jgi:hypothetical protein
MISWCITSLLPVQVKMIAGTENWKGMAKKRVIYIGKISVHVVNDQLPAQLAGLGYSRRDRLYPSPPAGVTNAFGIITRASMTYQLFGMTLNGASVRGPMHHLRAGPMCPD